MVKTSRYFPAPKTISFFPARLPLPRRSFCLRQSFWKRPRSLPSTRRGICSCLRFCLFFCRRGCCLRSFTPHPALKKRCLSGWKNGLGNGRSFFISSTPYIFSSARSCPYWILKNLPTRRFSTRRPPFFPSFSFA